MRSSINRKRTHFPSFSEGLSLRARFALRSAAGVNGFPFLFGGTFIEGRDLTRVPLAVTEFPFLFGGTFIEGISRGIIFTRQKENFPSFSEGLSLRVRRRFIRRTTMILFPFLFGGTFIEGRV